MNQLTIEEREQLRNEEGLGDLDAQDVERSRMHKRQVGPLSELYAPTVVTYNGKSTRLSH